MAERRRKVRPERCDRGRGRPARRPPGRDRLNRWKMLLNPQILLLCGIYFAIQLSVYANTFWLPSIIRRIPGTTDLSVGFLSAIPWVCAIVAMYFAARWQDKAQVQAPAAGGCAPGRRGRDPRRRRRLPGPGAGLPVRRRHGLQERVPVVLDHPPVRPASAGPRAGHRHHQLAGKPGRLRGARSVSASSRSRPEASSRGSSPSPRPRQSPPAWSISSRSASPRPRQGPWLHRGGAGVRRGRQVDGHGKDRQAPDGRLPFPSPMPRSVALACVLQVPVELFFGFAAPLTDDAQLLRDRISVAINVAVMRALQALGAGGQARPRFSIFAHTGMIPHSRRLKRTAIAPKNRPARRVRSGLVSRCRSVSRAWALASVASRIPSCADCSLVSGARSSASCRSAIPRSAPRTFVPSAVSRSSIVPPVGAAAHAGHQPSRFQRVDEGNHAARHRPQAVGQGPLAQSGAAAEQAEDTRVAWGQAEFARALGEACRCQRPELGQQESGSFRPRRIR